MLRSSPITLLLLLCASSAHAQLTLTGAGKNHSASVVPTFTSLGHNSAGSVSGTLTLTTTAASPVGSLVSAWTAQFGGGGTVTASDSAGNTYVCRAGITNAATSTIMWYCQATVTTLLPSSGVITISGISAAGAAAIVAGDSTGVTTIDVVGTPTTGTDTLGVPISPAATVTSTSSAGVSFGVLFADSVTGETITTPAPYTTVLLADSTTRTGIWVGAYVPSTAGAQSFAPSFNSFGGRSYGAQILTLK